MYTASSDRLTRPDSASVGPTIVIDAPSTNSSVHMLAVAVL
jgi:hypothetical protein